MNLSMHASNLKKLSLLLVSACFLSATVWAAGSSLVLIEGENKVNISEQDMQADALRMPLEMRTLVLQKPETVLQIASNLYARRVLAEQAVASGLDKDPQVVAALRVARDKVLSDARLEQIDKQTTPSDKVAEGLALNSYRAKQDRFKVGEEVRIRHILVSQPTPESRTKAEKILADLKNGGDFAALAKEHSADKGSSEKGGDLGYFTKGRMVPEFEAAAFALKTKGELSDIVQTSFGYHILKLDDRREPRVRPFSEVKDELIKEVRSNVTQEARAAEAQKIEQSAKINKEAVESFASRYKKPQ
jgi:peptidyl-prolyl cis-trans isomerase C